MKRIVRYLFLVFLLLTGCKDNVNEKEILNVEDVINWIEENYKDKVIDSDISLPIEYHDSQVKIELYSFDEEYLDDSGKFTSPIVDYETEILFVITICEEETEVFVPVVLKGYGDIFDAINYEINELVPERFDYSINLPTFISGYDCQIKWNSLFPDIISNEGYINKDPFIDKETVLEYTINCNKEERSYTKKIIVSKMTNTEKINLTSKWLDEKMKEIDVVDGDISLENKYEKYNAYIIWNSLNPTVITSKGKYYKPFNDEEVTLEASISIGTSSIKYKYNLTAKGENNTDIWEKIESFLEKINIKEVKNQKFYLYGCEAGYERVLSQNFGYIPFLSNEGLEINVDVLPQTSALKPNKLRDKTKYIVIHNTGMAHPTATAKGLNDYIHSTDRIASWHFSVDDKEAYQELDIDEVGWHAGDGSHVAEWSGGIGGGNLYGVAIESCVYEGVDFNKVLMNVAKLSASLMIKYDLGMESIKQHYDFNGKDCPQVIRHSSRWNELLNLIRLEYFLQTELNEVSFRWTSLTPDIMDDTGKIINHPGCETKVKYQVEVTYKNETHTYEFESTLDELK